MSMFRICRSRSFALPIGLAAAVLCLLRPMRSSSHAVQPAQNQGSLHLDLAANPVLVRVVVRDAQGKPVDGLRKGDFKIFDRGKERAISQFEEETGPREAANPPSLGMPSQPRPASRFLLVYFDDLHMSGTDVMKARNAANRYLAANLQPDERVALFTSSAMLSDFTADLKQLHNALLRLQPYPAATSQRDGPSSSRAWKSLQGLKQAVNIVSLAQAWKNIIFVSPGFSCRNHHYYLDRIIGAALYSNVVISSLDPGRLALPTREPESTNAPASSASSGVGKSQPAIDINRQPPVGNVLAEIAEGTGGEFLHDNNDLTAAFRALAGSQGSYLLAFTPTDTKGEGEFHPLKVSLTEGHEGFSLCARRGYFAGRPADEPPRLEIRPMASPMLKAEAQERARIREAVLSKTDRHELPVEVQTQVAKTAGNSELIVLAHLDAKALHLHKDGMRNRGTVTFVSVIYDGEGKYVTGQEQRAMVDLPDDGLPKLLSDGMNSKIVFQLRPGSYTIREVVTDSEEHQVTAFSRKVEVQ